MNKLSLEDVQALGGWEEILEIAMKNSSTFEAIRYPVYLFLTLIIGFSALVLLSSFFSEKWNKLVLLEEMKETIYSNKWLVIILVATNIVAGLLAFFIPAGVLSWKFMGDFFPMLAAFSAAVLILIDYLVVYKKRDVVHEGEEITSSNSRLAEFVLRFEWVFGVVIAVITLLHLVMGTVILF